MIYELPEKVIFANVDDLPRSWMNLSFQRGFITTAEATR
jgi:hypothetical protein